MDEKYRENTARFTSFVPWPELPGRVIKTFRDSDYISDVIVRLNTIRTNAASCEIAPLALDVAPVSR